jgi:capsule polysaccharide export protein KpsE/RkpR
LCALVEQVKAIKNEESSQISKLNDEIRALKERLMSQSNNGGSGEVKNVFEAKCASVISLLSLCLNNVNNSTSMSYIVG